MSSIISSCDWDIIEEKLLVSQLIFLNRVYNLNCLLSYIGIKYHFPLISPVSYGLQVFNKFFMSFINTFNRSKNGGIISKIYYQLDRLYILEKVRAKHGSLWDARVNTTPIRRSLRQRVDIYFRKSLDGYQIYHNISIYKLFHRARLCQMP